MAAGYIDDAALSEQSFSDNSLKCSIVSVP